MRPTYPSTFRQNATNTLQWLDNDNVTVTLVDMATQWLRSYFEVAARREQIWSLESGSGVFFRNQTLVHRLLVRTTTPMPEGNRVAVSAMRLPTIFLPEDQRQLLMVDWFSWADPEEPLTHIITFGIAIEGERGVHIWTDFP